MKKKSNIIFDDSDFPVSHVRKSIFAGTGSDMDEAAVKPMVAIVNSQTELNPGHMHLDKIAVRVKEGVHAGGGLPFEFNVPAPCDGIALGHSGMKYVLAQRELIADTIETHMRSMCYDAMVMVASCDKIIPGMLLAAARLDLPTIFITGGPNAWKIRYSSNMKDSVYHKDYEDLEDKFDTATCSTCGACEIMGTANTFQCMTEALGLSIPASANVPGFLSDKFRYARKAGIRVCEMIKEGLTAHKILTQKAVENAVMVDLAIGGSTNATLHLPALAYELGLELPLSEFNKYNKLIPTLCSINPNGPHGVVDLYVAGGVPAVMKRLKDDLHLDALNATGKTIGEVIEEAVIKDETVVPSKENAHKPEGGTVVLYGNLSPNGAVIKQAAVAEDMRSFTGKAVIYNSEAECLTAIRESKIEEGQVIIIRYEGPKGSPGMPEMLAVTMGLDLAGFKRVALITDGRFSGATSGPCIGHVSPEASEGGPIALLEEGDEISIDIDGRTFGVNLSDDELKERAKSWKPRETVIPPGYMRRYVKMVAPAYKGAVLE